MSRGSLASRGGFGNGQALPMRPFGGFGAQQNTSTLSYLAEPPSLAAISNPHVVVSLKNVLKKDSTTKGRALEELLGYVQQNTGDVEDALLDVWIQIYPRISIDNSRRVRELSHNLQLELLKSGRKRMERRLSGIVASWIAGGFDRDRAVARAASAGLSSLLDTPEKLNSFWLKCQSQILDFATEAIRETPDTLSDERSTTRDDADAKYFRVVYASLCLVLGLLQRAPADSLSKFKAQYEDYFNNGTVWKLIEAPDSTVRKAVCHLMFASLDRGLSYVDTKQSRLAFVTGGLRTSQTGSALEYIRALTKLTETNPGIWTATEGKKSPTTRLFAFIAKGSQGSPPKFWEQVDNLIQVLPADQESGVSLKHASELLSSVQSGITNREEPRTNTSMAWKCYIDTAKRLLTSLPPSDQNTFASDHMLPLFERFILSPTGNNGPIPLGPNSISVLVEAHNAVAQCSPELRLALVKTWEQLGVTLCTNIAGVLPEVSKDFQTSQDNLSEQGRRWFSLVGEIHTANADAAGSSSIVIEPSNKVVTHCQQLLKSRNMKPYGVARVMEFALSNSKHLFEGKLGSQYLDFLSSVADSNMQLVVESPSASSLMSSLRLLHTVTDHRKSAVKVWETWIKLILEIPPSPARYRAIISMISSEDVSKVVQGTPSLQTAISQQLCEPDHDSALLLEAALKFDALAPSTISAIANQLIERLGNVPPDSSKTLATLEEIVKIHKTVLLQDEGFHTALIRQLLALKETNGPEVSAKASRVQLMLGDSSQSILSPLVSIIQQNLESAGPQCLSIDTLAQQAQDAFDGGIPDEDIFPSTNSFMKSLLPFLERPVDPSIAIMNITGDLAMLVSPRDSMSHCPAPRDSKGRSIPVRMALYVCHLLNKRPKLSALPVKFQVELLYIQALVAQITSDQISLNSLDGPWSSLESSEALSQAEWLVSTSKRQMLNFVDSCTDWSDAAEIQTSIMPQVVTLLAQESASLTPTSLYSSRVLGELFQSVVEKHGIPASWQQNFLNSSTLKAAPDTVLLAAAVLSGMGNALRPLKNVHTLCNRLASDIAASKTPNENSAMMMSLMALCGPIYSGELPIANNRIVFAVKRITDWLEDGPELLPEIASVCMRSLGQLLPCMKEVYGSFWEKTLQFCMKSFEMARHYPLTRMLPLLHASLKLTKELQEMENTNDDLEEALSLFSKQKGAALVDLLRLDREASTQPLEIVDRLLFRELQKLSIRQLPEPEELYGLVAADSQVIQTAAYTMLHRIIPDQQQERSVDILLDKKNARLPDELLSLLLDAPTLEQFSDEALATFPLPIRGYLLSWKLIFDTYEASPFKIRQDFTEGLKADNPVSPLLDFLFDVLGHSAGYPLNLDKEGITKDLIKEFDVKLAEAEPEERSMHWLMSNVFYLTLKYLPGLFRRWYQESRSKQTKQAVESWTQSFFSSLLIESVLDDVQNWVDGKDFEASGEAEVTVKISKAAKEISAFYEIDESQGGICIKLPNNFPIDGVTVRGIRRVAVDERKWQNWIMTTQAVITFANGNIIDGVQAFRRNLTGALQGHTECAICYSVISSDQRLPEKSCTTCKNIFHRLCLYKWFQTSNNNTCPLCRTPIDFAGAAMQKRKA